MNERLEILALAALPEIRGGDDLAAMILEALDADDLRLQDDDVVVVAHKVVSKAEHRVVELSTVRPSRFAREWAERTGRDPRHVQVVLDESVRVVRMDRGVLIVETRHGFVCANAGVDSSNAPAGCVVLLPEDPDASAARLRDTLESASGARVAVVITDTWGRPWRLGIVNFAIGAAGLSVCRDERGRRDPAGRTLEATVVAVADEIASAAELVTRKLARRPVALVRGLRLESDAPASGAAALVRAPDEDLFR